MTQALQTSLVTISFEQCGLGDQEAVSIAEALAKNNCMKTLYLKTNSIKNMGANAIFQALKSLQSGIEHIDMSENLLDDDCGQQLVKTILSRNKFLLRILLKRNAILTYGKQLLNAIKANTVVQVLDLTDNHIELRQLDEIEAQLQLNRIERKESVMPLLY